MTPARLSGWIFSSSSLSRPGSSHTAEGGAEGRYGGVCWQRLQPASTGALTWGKQQTKYRIKRRDYEWYGNTRLLNIWEHESTPVKSRRGPPILSNAVVGLHGFLQRLLADPDPLGRRSHFDLRDLPSLGCKPGNDVMFGAGADCPDMDRFLLNLLAKAQSSRATYGICLCASFIGL